MTEHAKIVMQALRKAPGFKNVEVKKHNAPWWPDQFSTSRGHQRSLSDCKNCWFRDR